MQKPWENPEITIIDDFLKDSDSKNLTQWQINLIQNYKWDLEWVVFMSYFLTDNGYRGYYDKWPTVYENDNCFKKLTNKQFQILNNPEQLKELKNSLKTAEQLFQEAITNIKNSLKTSVKDVVKNEKGDKILEKKIISSPSIYYSDQVNSMFPDEKKGSYKYSPEKIDIHESDKTVQLHQFIVDHYIFDSSAYIKNDVISSAKDVVEEDEEINKLKTEIDDLLTKYKNIDIEYIFGRNLQPWIYNDTNSLLDKIEKVLNIKPELFSYFIPIHESLLKNMVKLKNEIQNFIDGRK